MQVPIFHQKQENVAFKVGIEWGITQKISVPYITMDSFHSLTAPSRQNFQNVLSPDASGFPVQRPPPAPSLALEFQNAVHGLVWIFSGIAQYIMLSLYHPPVIV